MSRDTTIKDDTLGYQGDGPEGGEEWMACVLCALFGI
jgi:hypothetical protein